MNNLMRTYSTTEAAVQWKPNRMPAPQPASFQFGDWIINCHHNTLQKGGHTQMLTFRLVSILIYLAERAGTIVGKEELLDAIWGRRVVGDDSLAVAISQIRKALEDDPRFPRYIKTLPRIGYICLVSLETIAD